MNVLETSIQWYETSKVVKLQNTTLFNQDSGYLGHLCNFAFCLEFFCNRGLSIKKEKKEKEKPRTLPIQPKFWVEPVKMQMQGPVIAEWYLQPIWPGSVPGLGIISW